jgi:hypothetical protein
MKSLVVVPNCSAVYLYLLSAASVAADDRKMANTSSINITVKLRVSRKNEGSGLASVVKMSVSQCGAVSVKSVL